MLYVQKHIHQPCLVIDVFICSGCINICFLCDSHVCVFVSRGICIDLVITDNNGCLCMSALNKQLQCLSFCGTMFESRTLFGKDLCHWLKSIVIRLSAITIRQISNQPQPVICSTIKPKQQRHVSKDYNITINKALRWHVFKWIKT